MPAPSSPVPAAEPLTLHLASETDTAALATAIAGALQPGTRIHLSGDLGSGKTAFTRALLRFLGHTGRVKSPTFSLVEPYNLSRFDLYHFDFYRLSSERAWLDAGFDEYLDGNGVAVIEWPEMADGLPAPDLLLRFDYEPAAGEPAAGETTRRVTIEAASDRGRACLNAIRAAGCCTPAPGPEPASR
ncbi:MAG: tRNA (adenosine(37)-N6)-threonylcarbamoyltransferase complex ATPase subunit type 1 TsaE [Burkholderiaceae bacterium]